MRLNRPALVRLARRSALAVAVLAVVAGAGLWLLDRLDRAFPPPLDSAAAISTEVVDRNGVLLRAYALEDGRWRLGADLDRIDRAFLAMLVAYEDQRFWSHRGVDPLALLRAAGQFLANGRIVSGGSTLTMQLARLIEPRAERSLGAKLRQMARALQIERRLSKREILTRYLTLAPYGGNLEGVRAASLAWFGKDPARLSLPQAALLVALPQSPEARRPDRHPDAARAARDRVLARMAGAGVIVDSEVARAAAEPVLPVRHPLPGFAAHVADAALREEPAAQRHQLTIDRGVQERLERVAKKAAARIGPKVSVAIVLARADTGAILAKAGSADYFDAARAGWIDMARVVRSPGSTLKPFIYGLAFEDGLVMQETTIEDRPTNFAGYRPKNFDMEYQGDVSVRQALQLSLNVPAVRLLDTVGPVRLVARMKRGGVMPTLPEGERPGLAIGLGGVGLSLEELVQLYTGLSQRGRVARLHSRADAAAPKPPGEPILSPQAVWQITDILSGVAPPQGAPRLGIAYKTGTSYGYRDAWSVGYDGRHVIGVWVGRPDGGAVPGLTGYLAAAPILFEAFAKTGLGIAPQPRPPAGAVRLARAELPFAQRRFAPSARESADAPVEPAPEIVYPPQGARVDLGLRAGATMPLALKINGGRAPFRWLANGRPVRLSARRRTAAWTPDGAGASTLTVIDAAGRAASVNVFLE
ncbi:MAG: penicillin-binding protein 1C [Nitratireductor sp.]